DYYCQSYDSSSMFF
nr:immunoglobulin light chain junction region [Macaca mulatta]MOW36251.1 immunoglobulin light chain junction region [Macaca mulatta]MOW36284.1 immunoglobulin light chain junction region [Macaca mulatta]MOW36808.1 immunoglobulin light chain junction region [Macaca mulatta]MOW37100.1 immunoglobulin light chain junction region [Macaca mulatta]